MQRDYSSTEKKPTVRFEGEGQLPNIHNKINNIGEKMSSALTLIGEKMSSALTLIGAKMSSAFTLRQNSNQTSIQKLPPINNNKSGLAP